MTNTTGGAGQVPAPRPQDQTLAVTISRSGQRRSSPLSSSDWAVFAVRRAGGLTLSLGLLLLVTFLIVPLIPGDPAMAMLGSDATPQAVEQLRTKMGLEDPLIVQFWSYLVGVATGGLGTSFRYGIPVSEIIATKLPYTAGLAFGSIIMVLIVSIPLGLCIGVLTRGGRRGGLAAAFGAIAGFLASFPTAVAGTVLVVIFAIWLKWLPAGGAEGPVSMLLPIIALSIGPAFAVTRVVRQETYGVLLQDFMRTARGKRLGAARRYLLHALPNLMASTLTLTGLVLAGLVGGTIVIETVFSYPGLGLEVVQSIIYKDYPTIQGIILVIGSLAILINLIVDIVLGLIDPRSLGGSINA